MYLVTIRFIGGVMIWISLGLSIIIMAATGFYTYFYARPQYDPLNPTYTYLEYTSYVVWSITAIFSLAVLCCCNAIKIGIAVFKTTIQFIQANMEIFALPYMASLCTVIWFVMWLFAAVFIFSVGTPEPRDLYPFVTEMKWDVATRCIFIYHVFGLLWINAFLIGSIQFIIGAAACIWYFEVNTDSKGKQVMGKATKWLFRYHLGSIAFGSAIIAICQMIRLIFEYYRRKMGTLSKELKWVKVLLVMTGYVLWLLEHCVKYMTKNAYI